ncbi:2-oxoglutarate (2OG) and Fe(II)-dependent oxygenase superfamily protein [Actinidia rufa]|uniref:2-oxoglutarate (2OG) and Fe(II)-dependent oxygenase superfamily protein n=1 Tax=Actinidia rufa TaxID=165716 RepID=A0A7J0GR80_9ERIC|nr:2-oxoglutarate (2OG) and Fe(II)-dependent oxygenase superfamily protein [Actinidia rufa]
MSPPNYYDSYPPLFRPNTTPLNGQVQENPPTPDPDPLPVIDLERLAHDGERQKLAQACQDWGIFRLVNHGVPTTLLAQLYGHAKRIFSLGFESKQTQICGPVAYFWGTPALNLAGRVIEREEGPPTSNVKWFEGFNVVMNKLLEVHVDDPLLDSFRLLLEEYGRHQTRLATTIFEAMAKDLSLDQEQSDCYLCPSSGSMRVYRYLRCPEADQVSWGIDAHTDSSVLSILNHPEVGGFQVQKDNEWLDVEPVPNTLVVILGDMMQAMSHDKYKSVKHRVKANKHEERISVGYFVFPDENGVIRSPKYKPFTYADFRAQVQQDLKTIGYKESGLHHFKLNHTT